MSTRKVRQITIELPMFVESEALFDLVADLALSWESEHHADRKGWDISVSATSVDVDDLDYPDDGYDSDPQPPSEITHEVGVDPSLGERLKAFLSWHRRHNTRVSSQPKDTAFHD